MGCAPDELRVDCHMVRLLTKGLSALAEPQRRQREGRVSPLAQAQAQAEEGAPESWSVGGACVSLLSFASMCHCGDGSTASPDWLHDRWLLLGEYWVG